MDSNQIRKELDELIVETVSYDQDALPKRLLSYLSMWKWGKYGWVCRKNRPYRDQEREPFRKEHSGQPYHGAEAEGRGHRDLFRERKYMDAGF